MSYHPLVTFRRLPPHFDRIPVDAFAETLQRRVSKGADFHVLISNDEELQRLNLQFRGKDSATDVLSFPGEGDYLGDIAISLNRAREQAIQCGHPLIDELRILMLHGMLHLMGMDHEADAGEMERTEKRWRRKFALPLGLIERAGRARQ